MPIVAPDGSRARDHFFVDEDGNLVLQARVSETTSFPET